MSHRIKELRTDDDLKLYAIFTNGIEKSYDVREMFTVYAPMKELEEPKEYLAARFAEARDERGLTQKSLWDMRITEPQRSSTFRPMRL